MRNPKEYRSHKLNVRLSFNEGYAELPIYSIKASTSEKEKGFDMIHLICDNFNINIRQYDSYLEEKNKKLMKEVNGFENKPFTEKVHWTKDEQGNIISPFKTKKILS